MSLSTDEMGQRISMALDIAVSGMNDGAHHKMWVIDQMVRALTGCPLTKIASLDYKGQPFIHEVFVESEEYKQWVATIQSGEDGPNTYEWEVGIAP